MARGPTGEGRRCRGRCARCPRAVPLGAARPAPLAAQAHKMAALGGHVSASPARGTMGKRRDGRGRGRGLRAVATPTRWARPYMGGVATPTFWPRPLREEGGK